MCLLRWPTEMCGLASRCHLVNPSWHPSLSNFPDPLVNYDYETSPFKKRTAPILLTPLQNPHCLTGIVIMEEKVHIGLKSLSVEFKCSYQWKFRCLKKRQTMRSPKGVTRNAWISWEKVRGIGERSKRK